MLCRQVGRAVPTAARQPLAQAGFGDLRPADNAVLLQLWPGGRRITEMAGALGLTKQSVKLLVDHLEARGYVRRKPDPSDARAKRVELSPRGRRAAAFSVRVAVGFEDQFHALLGDERLLETKAALRLILEGLGS